MNSHDFSHRQIELMSEFARYAVEHPEVDDALPEHSYIFFEMEGEEDFNRYSRDLAEKRRQAEGAHLVLIRVKGLAPPHGSRLIEPVIQPVPARA